MAREQGALSLELRAAMSLAALLGRRGRGNEAEMLLRPIYEQFAEGLDTADLKAARAMLCRIGENPQLTQPVVRRVNRYGVGALHKNLSHD
jgi:predicted ATPase